MAPEQQSTTNASDEKLLSILFAIKEKDLHTITALSEELGFAKSTIHAHLTTLAQQGFIHQDDKNRYHLGLRFLEFGSEARDRYRLYHVSKEKVNQLAEETGEKVWCVVEEQETAVYLYEATGENAIQTNEIIGQRRPLHTIAAGKAILAFLPTERREHLLESLPLEPEGPKTITDRDELRDELETIRERESAYNVEELMERVNAVACPIRKEGSGVFGAISIGGPARRLTVDRMETEHAELLRGVTNEIEINLRHG